MATRNGSNSNAFWGTYASAAQLPNVSGATVQKSGVVEVGDQAYVSATSLFYVCTTATAGAAVWAPLATNAYADSGIMANPPAASTGDVVIDTGTSTVPRSDYYMAPAANQTFDPTAATVSQRVTITKTTTTTNKLTIKVGAGASVAGFTIQQQGTINTNMDLPGSATAVVTAYHQWTLSIDVPNKIVYLSPAA